MTVAADEPREEPSAPRRKRRIGRVFVLLLGLLLVSGDLWLPPIASPLLRDALTGSGADEVVVGELSGGWFLPLVVRGVRLDGFPATSTLQSVEVAEIRVEGWKWAWARDDWRHASIDVTDAVVELRTTDAPAEETPLVERVAELRTTADETLAGLLDGLPRVSLTGDVRLDGASVSDGLTVTVVDDVVVVEVARPRLPGEPDRRIELSEHWSAAFDLRSRTLSVPAAGREAPSAAGLDDLSLRVELPRRRPTILSLQAGLAGGTVSIDGTREELAASAQAVDLARLPAWLHDALPDELGAPAGGVTAEATVSDLEYVVGRIDVQGAALGPRGADAVTATFEWSRETGLRLPELRVTETSGEVVVQEFVLPPSGTWSVRHVDVATTDGRRLATRLLGLEDASSIPAGAWDVTARFAPGDQPNEHVVENATWTSAAARVTATGRVRVPTEGSVSPTLTLGGEITAAAVRTHYPEAGLADDVAGTLRLELELAGLDPLRLSGTVVGDGLRVGEETVEALAVELTTSGSRVELRRGRVSARGTAVELSGSLDLETGRAEALTATVRIDDLASLSRWSDRLPALAGALRLDARLSGELGLPVEQGRTWSLDDLRGEGSLDLTGDGLVLDDLRLGTLRIRGRLDGRRALLDELELTGPEGRVTARGALDEQRLTLEDLTADLPDLSTVAERVSGAPAITGSLRATGRIDVDLAALEADARLDLLARDLTLDGTRLGQLRTAMRARGREATLESLSLRGEELELAAAGRVTWDEERVRGDLTAFEAVVHLADRDLHFRAASSTAVEYAAERLELARTTVEVLGGEATIEATFDTRSGEADVSLDGTDVDLAWFQLGLAGRTDVQARLTGTWESPTGRVNVVSPELEVAEARMESRRGRLVVEVLQTDDALRITELDVDAGAVLAARGSATLPWRLRSGELVSVPDVRPEADLELRSEQTEPWLALFAPAELRVASVEARVQLSDAGLTADGTVGDPNWVGDLPRGPGIGGPIHVELRSGERELRLRVVGGGEGPTQIDGRLTLGAVPDWGRPESIPDAVSAATLTGEIGVGIPDIAPLGAWFEDLVRIGGSVEGRVQLGGTVAEPTWTGSLSGTDLGLRLDADTPPIGRGRLRLTFDPRRLRIEELRAELGRSPFSASGEVTLVEDGPPRLDLVIQGENTLLARNDDLLLRADLDLKVTGDVETPRLSGTTRITRGLYLRPMSLLRPGATHAGPAVELPSLRTEPLASTRLDVEIRADETIRIENDLLEGAFQVDLHVGGTGAAPVPTGRVDFRGVHVSLPFSRLKVERGALVFPVDSPTEPEIQATGRTRMRGYDLLVVLSGPVDEVDVQVSSTPPLPSEDALLLLTTGSTREDLEQQGIGRVALGKAGTLIGDALLTWVSGPSRPGDESWADRVTIEFGREQSRSGVTTLDAELQVAERWFLHAERDRYDAVNAGIVWRLTFR